MLCSGVIILYYQRGGDILPSLEDRNVNTTLPGGRLVMLSSSKMCWESFFVLNNCISFMRETGQRTDEGSHGNLYEKSILFLALLKIEKEK